MFQIMLWTQHRQYSMHNSIRLTFVKALPIDAYRHAMDPNSYAYTDLFLQFIVMALLRFHDKRLFASRDNTFA